MWLLLNLRFSYHNFNENNLSFSVGVFSFLQIFLVFDSSAAERANLQNEIERMKELLHTYETSIQRKDQVISNLTQALGKQRDKQEAMRTFSEWKVQHVDLKREVSQGGVGIANPWSKTTAEIYDPHHVLAMVKKGGVSWYFIYFIDQCEESMVRKIITAFTEVPNCRIAFHLCWWCKNGKFLQWT